MERSEFLELLKLSRLDIEDEKLDSFYQNWINCMGVLDKIVEFDEDREPLFTVNESEKEPACDKPEEGLDTSLALKNASDKQYGYFKVIKYV